MNENDIFKIPSNMTPFKALPFLYGNDNCPPFGTISFSDFLINHEILAADGEDEAFISSYYNLIFNIILMSSRKKSEYKDKRNEIYQYARDKSSKYKNSHNEAKSKLFMKAMYRGIINYALWRSIIFDIKSLKTISKIYKTKKERERDEKRFNQESWYESAGAELLQNY